MSGEPLNKHGIETLGCLKLLFERANFSLLSITLCLDDRLVSPMLGLQPSYAAPQPDSQRAVSQTL